MGRRVGVSLAGIFLLSIVSGACVPYMTAEQDDKQTAINVVLAHELACQTFDFDELDSLHTPDSLGIEESYPGPTEPGLREWYQTLKNAEVRIDYHPQDAVAQVRGDVAWVTITLHSIWTAATPQGRAMIGGEWHVTFVESCVLVRTPMGWKIALGHTSQLPADFGIDPDYQAERGGMKLVKVPVGGPAGKAGLKPGDVLIDYGGHKIDSYIDYGRLRYFYSEGEQVKVTVMRGHEKITKQVTLEAMK